MRRSCEARIDIAAPPASVWAVVTDVTRVGEWSGECRGCEWVGGARAAVVGARFRGHNRRLLARWTRTNQVFAADEPHRFVWRTMPGGVYPDSVEWEVALEERGSGTSVRLSFSVITIPRAMELVIDAFMPPHRDRTDDLAGDLGRLKALVEAPLSDQRSNEATRTHRR
jgi:uncharacterized protein YndB with AHSA1/START domain